ncbi:MAG: hypothetical protein IPI35_27425 [Deltaproteobacteria bacterium]|nr:hypothetical protein [Deltaproteobacteria bacterium]
MMRATTLAVGSGSRVCTTILSGGMWSTGGSFRSRFQAGWAAALSM